ncbi:MAG: ABC transporter permease [Luteimonas sp.]
MYTYYLSLAWRNFRNQPWYNFLITLILGAGVGVFMTTYSLLSVLSGDPIPQKSQRLLHLQIGTGIDNDQSIALMPSTVVQALRKTLPEVPLVAITYGFGGVESDRGDRRAADLLRFANAGFFQMFDAPLLHGRGWSAEEETQGVPVAVIGREFAESMFDTAAAVGRSIVVADTRFRVIGILDDWQPTPRYYDLSVGAYAPADQVYLPLSSVRALDDDIFMARSCPAGVSPNVAPAELEHSRCAWLSVWALLQDPVQRSLVQSRVETLLRQGKQEGWLGKESGSRVENVRDLLRRKAVVPGGVRFGMLLAVGFLLLCLINAAGLLLAKCLRRSQEIGVRRALGASRLDIALQFMTESSLLGLVSSAFGTAFAAIGVHLAQQLPKGYMQLADFSLPMLLLALATSVIVGIAAGLFPAWRASQVEPAIQIKID